MIKQPSLTRRHYLAASGAGVLALGLGSTRGVAAPETIRQGYQTNIWGMPTYYLMKSGYLKKHNLAAEEFAVPSGNLTMQQMVARQVDLGTYAGQSFIIGSAKGGLIAIALIEHVGKTARITTRKDLNITKVEELRGLKIANQTGSSVGNVFVDTIMPQHGLKKGDYQEVRMDVNNMVAALAAKTVDAMVNVEPYNVIAGGDARVRAAEARHRDRLSQSLARRGAGFQEQSEKGRRRHLRVLRRQGLQDIARRFRHRVVARRGQPRLSRRPQALYAGTGGNPAQGQEDRRHPGLDQGAAARSHGTRPLGGVTSAIARAD